jgi:hypothetical protein
VSVVNVPPGRLGAFLRSKANALPRAAKGAMTVAAQRGRSVLVKASPVDQGQFKNAWEVQKDEAGARIENLAPHAGIVERGARPHKVSAAGVEALRAWVKRNLSAEVKGLAWVARKHAKNDVLYTKTTNFREGKDGLMRKSVSRKKKTMKEIAEMMIDEIVLGIVRKLAKYGQKGKFTVKKNLPLLRKFLKEETERRLHRHFSAPPDKGTP